MTIYADTSFWVSFLYTADKGHAAARTAFGQHVGAEWLTSDWAGFETANSLRQLCVQAPTLAPSIPEALRRYWKHLHEKGPLRLVTTRFDDALRDSHQYSTAHATMLTMRSADVLHVALMEQINPDLFITRDRKQHELAVARAFRTQLVP